MIVSWNVTPGTYLKVEARGIYPDHATAFRTLGLWSDDPAHHPRQSVAVQHDAEASVKTDTLVLSHPAAKTQVRLTIGGSDVSGPARLKFLGLCFYDSRRKPKSGPSNHSAWGRELEVPERRQGEYQGGGGWCSPASVSMVMAYWSAKLHRPELDRSVPVVAASVSDPIYHGTGNPFSQHRLCRWF